MTVRRLSSRLLVDARCTLGEGLVWNIERQAWFWLDIQEARIWSHHPASETHTSWALPDRAGAFCFTESGGVVIALSKRLVVATIPPTSGEAVATRELVEVESRRPETRTNDGRTDREGRFVFGTMNEADDRPLGAIYQFSADYGLRQLPLGHVAIANSICFNPAGDEIYFCDSLTRQIMRADYHSRAASVSGVRVFARLEARDVVPDGSIIDEDGGLWNSEWGGSRICRYTPGGALDVVAELPVPHVSCPALGGPGLDRLCTTTARWLMSSAAVEAMPEAGGVFSVEGLTGVRGLPDTPMFGF